MRFFDWASSAELEWRPRSWDLDGKRWGMVGLSRGVVGFGTGLGLGWDGDGDGEVKRWIKKMVMVISGWVGWIVLFGFEEVGKFA